jgi:hypothetical protein
VWEEVARLQDGVITRTQVLAVGLSSSAIDRRLRSGRWRRVYAGVYATFTGPMPRSAMLWAAVLQAGPGATLSHQTAAEMAGLIEQPVEVIHVMIPVQRRVQVTPGHQTSRV